MGIKEKLARAIPVSRFVKELMVEFAPDMLEEKIGELVDGKTVQQFYGFLDDSTLWAAIPAKNQQWLLERKPWRLDWLTLDWVTNAIGKYNPKLGVLVVTSPDVQERLKEHIEEVKAILA